MPLLRKKWTNHKVWSTSNQWRERKQKAVSEQRPVKPFLLTRTSDPYWETTFGVRTHGGMQNASNTNTAQVYGVEENPPPQVPFDPFADISYMPNITEIDDSKTDDCLINSGALQKFFYNKSSFLSYKNFENEMVCVANSSSIIVDEGEVKVRFGRNKIIFTAF